MSLNSGSTLPILAKVLATNANSEVSDLVEISMARHGKEVASVFVVSAIREDDIEIIANARWDFMPDGVKAYRVWLLNHSS